MNIALDVEGRFALTLPNGHTVHVPVTAKGVSILARILADHAESPTAPIGARAAPIQYMVDQWLREDAERKETKRQKLLASLDIEIAL